MNRTWNTTKLPLDEKLIIWIKSKIEGTKRGTIIIEIKDSRVISIHYRTSEYVLDVDSQQD
ncbi:MAG: hypothetical protein AMJ78_00765 [Omnitrophica WOR_2 bacterium SM23_29]|nr:MAG: hypothetical protein AMJ78_00765 [Omnitrophica WOR_2 bacterium SM23_29]